MKMKIVTMAGALLLAGGVSAAERAPGEMRVPFPNGRRATGQCVVNGTDFMAQDDCEFPFYDKDRNLLVNPSFESGVRYFAGVRSRDWMTATVDMAERGTKTFLTYGFAQRTKRTGFVIFLR